MKRKITSIFLAMTLLVASFSVHGAAVSYKGNISANLSWKLGSSGTLSLVGADPLPGYDGDEPWSEHKDKITAVNLGKEVVKFDETIFAALPVLEKFIVESGNEVYRAEQGMLVSADKKTVYVYPCGRAADHIDLSEVSEKLEAVYDYAFYLCDGVSSAVLPDSVKYIGSYAFYGTGITEMEIPESVEYIGEHALDNIKIIGCGGSVAERYALENGLEFVNLSVCEHRYSECETVAPTCTESGYTLYRCSLCGDIQKDARREKLGHDYETVTVPQSENAPGYVERHCLRCGISEVIEIIDDGNSEPQTEHIHDFTVLEIIAPICTKTGYTTFVCACGQSLKGDKTAKLGHDYREFTVEAADGQNGYTVQKCTRCGAEKSGTLTPLTTEAPPREDETTEPATTHIHDFTVLEIIAPTCTKTGYTVFVCDCGQSLKGDKTAKLGHDYQEFTVETADGQNGYTVQKCTRCGAEKSGTLTPLTTEAPQEVSETTEPATTHIHDFTVFETVAPTCTKSGYTSFVCDCGASYKGLKTAKLGHDYIETVIDPIPGRAGYTLKKCSRCGDEKTGGYTEYTTAAPVTEPAPPTTHYHNYEAHEVIPPTCTKKGYTLYVCTLCGDTQKGSETAKLGHDYEKTIVGPTPEKPGYTLSVCRRCGESKTSDLVDYESFTQRIKGDVNLDGKVKANDARLCLRAAAEMLLLTGIPFENADVNGDGKVKAADARKILRHAAGLELL